MCVRVSVHVCVPVCVHVHVCMSVWKGKSEKCMNGMRRRRVAFLYINLITVIAGRFYTGKKKYTNTKFCMLQVFMGKRQNSSQTFW